MKDKVKVKAKVSFEIFGKSFDKDEVKEVSKFEARKLLQLNRVWIVEETQEAEKPEEEKETDGPETDN